MSGRREIWEVARREFVERLRSRTLRVSFAILLVLVAASAVAATLSSGGRPTDDFGLVGPRAVALAPALELASRADNRKASFHRLRNRAAAERALRTGDLDVAIVGERLVVHESRSTPAVRVAQRAVTGRSVVTRLRAAGLTQQQVLDAVTPRPAAVTVLDPGAPDRERDTGMLSIGVLVLFAALLIYGQSVASSVTEEKSSRVIELLLTTLPPRRLLGGKVLGVGALGVAQVSAVCATGLLAANIAGDEGLPPSAGGTVALVLLWFVLGFAFFSVAYAALGALVSRQEDLESTTAPVNVLLIAGYLGANAAVGDPDGTWAQIAAFVPPLAPMVVPTRVVLGDMGPAELAAAVAVELLAIALIIRVAAGIYERSILRVGAPVRLRAVLAGGVRRRLHVPLLLLQGTAVAALLAGAAVGASRPLGIVLIFLGLLLTLVLRHLKRQPPALHG